MKGGLLLALALLPDPRPGYRVYDFADLLSPATAQHLEDVSRDVDAKTTAEIAVVTVSSLEGMSVDEYGERLGTAWGVGKRETNNGVILLVAPNERRARIEVGYGLEPLLPDGFCGEILDEYAVPHFKRGDYPGGIVTTTEEIARVLRANPEMARGLKGSAPRGLRRPGEAAQTWAFGGIAASIVAILLAAGAGHLRRFSILHFLVSLLVIVGAGAGAVFEAWRLPTHLRPTAALGGYAFALLFAFLYLIKKFLRFGFHRCGKCGTAMQLLDEAKDDEKLTEAMRVEEKIGSLDYDIWVCPACLSSHAKTYKAWFSGFKRCHKCAHQTFQETETILHAATTVSSGEKRIDGTCVSCKHSTIRREHIPRIVVSHSSSGGGGWSGGGGGSFGGGSFGGGGASRGW